MLTRRTSTKEAAGPNNTGGAASGGGRGVGEEAACVAVLRLLRSGMPEGGLSNNPDI